MPNQYIESQEDIIKKISTFFKIKVPVHIRIKDSTFRNGYITQVRSDFFEIDDFLNGKEFIFFLETAGVEQFKPPTFAKMEKKDE